MASDFTAFREKLLALCQPEIELRGLNLFDLEILGGGGRLTCRFFVDRGQGEDRRVGIDECAQLSRALGRALDAEGEDFVPGRYLIEVSSPGIFCPLKQPEHFRHFLRERVKVVAETPDGKTDQFIGTLLEAGANEIGIQDASGEEHRIAYDRIRKAHLDPQLDFGGKNRS